MNTTETPIETDSAHVPNPALSASLLFDELPPIFRDAVCDEGYTVRYDIELPWVASDGFCYATDGRIVVRVAATDEIKTLVQAAKPERFRLPDARAFFGNDDFYRAEPTPIMSKPVAFTICDECDGFGEMVCYDSRWECEDCSGTGKYHNLDRVTIGENMDISAYYAAILRRHDAKCYLPVKPNTEAVTAPLRFVADQAEGRLMPLFPEKEMP